MKTLVHETAHSMLHNKEVNQDILAPVKDRNTKEIEAEGIAFTVCSHFGIDTSSYSFHYIGGWSSGRDIKELKSSLDTIRRTSSELITGIEEQQGAAGHRGYTRCSRPLFLCVEIGYYCVWKFMKN